MTTAGCQISAQASIAKSFVHLDVPRVREAWRSRLPDSQMARLHCASTHGPRHSPVRLLPHLFLPVLLHTQNAVHTHFRYPGNVVGQWLICRYAFMLTIPNLPLLHAYPTCPSLLTHLCVTTTPDPPDLPPCDAPKRTTWTLYLPINGIKVVSHTTPQTISSARRDQPPPPAPFRAFSAHLKTPLRSTTHATSSLCADRKCRPLPGCANSCRMKVSSQGQCLLLFAPRAAKG